MTEKLFKLKKYLSLAHHVKGRIRIKFDLGIIKEIPFAELQNFDPNIPGVIDTRINAAAQTAVIRYDPQVIAPADIEKILTSNNLQECESIFNKYVTQEAFSRASKST